MSSSLRVLNPTRPNHKGQQQILSKIIFGFPSFKLNRVLNQSGEIIEIQFSVTFLPHLAHLLGNGSFVLLKMDPCCCHVLNPDTRTTRSFFTPQTKKNDDHG